MALSDEAGVSVLRCPAGSPGSATIELANLLLATDVVSSGGMLECPLMAISGHSEGSPRTSALPPKADIGEGIAECPLLTQSGHWRSPSAPDLASLE